MQRLQSNLSMDASIEDVAGDLARQTTQEAQDLFHARIEQSITDLEAVTGEPTDIAQDANFAIGDVHLTFKDVSFSLPLPKGIGIMRAGSQTPKSCKSGKSNKTISSVDNRKVVLAPISGHYEPGNLVALMGPSGCGKTTLLDILAGKKTAPYEGTVHVNGRPRDELFRRISAYVPQDDTMPAHLTVEEVVRFQNALKEARPSRITRSMRGLLIEKRLRVLGLLDIKNSYVGDPAQGCRGISGGQRRRLSLARGLASGAQILFCDEPTSGLSSTDAEACVKYMRLVAHKYCVTIIVSIHQPRREVAKLFDQLLLLTANPGRTVYQGPMAGLPAYMEQVGYAVPKRANPTDFCMDLITPGTKSSLDEEFVEFFDEYLKPDVDCMVQKELLNERKKPMQLLEAARQPMEIFGSLPPLKYSRYGVSFAKQFRMNFLRQLTLRLRDKMLFLGDVGAAVAKAVILALAYYDIGKKSAVLQTGFFFFVLMCSSIDGLKTMPRLISERTIMKMETSEAVYSEWAYILPFSILSSLQALVTHSLFIVLLWPFLGFPWELFIHVWFWTMMNYFVMDSLYLMVSGIAKDATQSQMLSLPFLILFLLYNGYLVTRNTCPSWIRWAVDISPVAYAIEAITVAAGRVCSAEVACGKDHLYPSIISHFGYKDEEEIGMGDMCAVMFVFRVIHMACLKFLNNIQR